jgi:subtilisin family serine protease
LRTKRIDEGRALLPGRWAVLRVAAAAALVLALAGPSTSPAAAAGAGSPSAHSAGLLIGLDSGMPLGERHALTTGVLAGAKPLAPGIRFLDVRRNRVPLMAQRVGEKDGVRYAEPNYLMQAAAAPDDPSFGLEWPLANTGQTVNGVVGVRGADEDAVPAWEVTTGDSSIVVGEIDSGVDYLHPDLAANIWSNPGGIGGCPAGTHGYNAISGSCDPMDDDTKYNGHGTHVAGIIGAVGDNGIGVTGVNWSTTILPVKFLNSAGKGSTSQLIAAMEWLIAARQAGVNVRVVNLSNSQTVYSQALADEIDRLGANNILFVTAASNVGDDNDDPTLTRYPCGNDNANLICVAASTQKDTLANWSSYGANTVDLAAPGANIYSTLRNGTYGYIKGTSMSTAEVSGAAALILASTDLSTTALKAEILDNVDPLPSLAGKVLTGGRLDICQAMSACHTEALGKTTVGASAEALVSNRTRVNEYSLGGAGTVKGLRVYLQPSSTSGSQDIRGVIYGDAGGAPGALLSASNQLVFHSSDSPGWYDLPLPEPVSLQPGSYWIGLHAGSTSKVARVRWDSVPGSRVSNIRDFSSGPSDPFGAVSSIDDREMSLHALYTSQAASAP